MDTLSDILQNMVPKLFVFFHSPVIYIGTDPVAKVCKTFVGENVKALQCLCPLLLYFHWWWTLTTRSVYQLNVRNSLLCSAIRRYTISQRIQRKEKTNIWLVSFLCVQCAVICGKCETEQRCALLQISFYYINWVHHKCIQIRPKHTCYIRLHWIHNQSNSNIFIFFFVHRIWTRVSF